MPYYTPKLLTFRCIQLIARLDLARAIELSDVMDPEEHIRINAVYPKVSVALFRGYPTFRIVEREVKLASGDLFDADPCSSLIKISP